MFTRPFQGPRGRDAAFLAACLILAVAIVPGALLRGDVLSHSQLLFEYAPWQGHAPGDLPPVNSFLVDPPLVFYPFLAAAVDAVRHLRLPVWSAGLYAGHPFLASFQTAVCSPFMPLAYLVPLPWATIPLALVPLVVGAIGMRRCALAVGSGEAGSWYAGLAWLLNGFAIVWLEHPLTAVACWVPWLLLAIERLVGDPQPRRAALLALAIAASILSGHPETSLKVLLFAGAWAVCRAWHAPRSTWVVLAAGAVAGALLASVQVIPFAEYLGLSEALARRHAAAGNTFVLPPETLVTALVPDFFGNPAHGAYLARVNRFGIAANYGEQQVYAGTITMLLAPLGLVVARRDARARFFAGAALVAGALMYGAPGLLDVVSHLPVLRVSILSRFGVVVIACVILLAARAVDAIAGERPERADGDRAGRHLGVIAIGIGVTLLAAIGTSYATFGPALAEAQILERTRDASIIAAILLCAATAIAWLSLRRRLRPRIGAALLCVVVAGELVVQAQGFHPTIAASDVLPVVPAIEAVRRDQGLYRVYGWGTALLPDTAMAYGLQDARGWDGVQPARYTRLLDLGYLRQSKDPARHLEDPVLLDLLNVKYVFVPRGLRLPSPRFVPVPGAEGVVFENTMVQPRAWLAAEYAVMADREIESVLHGHRADLRRLVLLERELQPDERPAGTPSPSDTAVVRHYRDTFVEVETVSAARRILVLADANYPGWRATVDGRDVTIYRADYALRAVSVPPGRHVVRFSYQPWTVRFGAIVSMLVAVAIATTLGPRRSASA
jgi:hypothetical protein